MGLTGYYKKFVKGYASITAPLTDLLKTDAYVWNNTTEEAFQKLKQALIQTLVLTLPDFTKTFSLEIDASTHPVGAVLLQEKHPIAYFSKKLCPRMQRASTYLKELYGITTAIAKWRHYLLGAKFQIYTSESKKSNAIGHSDS